MALRKGVGAALAGLGGLTTYRYQQILARESQLPQQALSVFTEPADKEDEKPKKERSSILKQALSIFTATPTDDKEEDKTTLEKKERVLIIGAGVVGVCTAYKLAKLGHPVAVLEPSKQAGDECSAAAAGGLSRANVVVDRNSWVAVLKCVVPFLHKQEFQFFHIDWFKSLSDPFFLRWATTFTRTSLLPSADQQAKQQEMLKFTDWAVQDMIDMLEDPKDDMSTKAGYNNCGSLAVSYEVTETPKEDPTRDATTTTTTTKKPEESSHPSASMNLEPVRKIHTTHEVLDLEPSLRHQQELPTSANFAYDCKSASSGRFSKELARRCLTDPKLDVAFLYETKVEAITTTTHNTNRQLRIDQIYTNKGIITVPPNVRVVVTAGAWTPHVLSLLGLYAPVYPLKGYAMSVSAKRAIEELQLMPEDLPSRIVCDKYVYTTRLGADEIRITSIGEFSEWNTSPTPHVDTIFRQEAQRQFPQLSPLISEAKTVCGHRPFVSDGILLLGKCTTHHNLYVSCGPGSNGWKLAMGSGDVIARLISGQTAKEMETHLGFDPMAFAPHDRVLYSPLFAKLCRARWNV